MQGEGHLYSVRRTSRRSSDAARRERDDSEKVVCLLETRPNGKDESAVLAEAGLTKGVGDGGV